MMIHESLLRLIFLRQMCRFLRLTQAYKLSAFSKPENCARQFIFFSDRIVLIGNRNTSTGDMLYTCDRSFPKCHAEVCGG
jgi:hypothetical protein